MLYYNFTVFNHFSMICIRLLVLAKKVQQEVRQTTECLLLPAHQWAELSPFQRHVQMKEPSHCRRLATATQSIRSSAEHQRPGRNQCQRRITRTCTNQFPVSWNSVGGSWEECLQGEEDQSYTGAHDKSNKKKRDSCVRQMIDWTVFSGARHDEILPFISDLSAPHKLQAHI